MGFFFMPTLFTAQNGLENHQKPALDVRGLLHGTWGARVRGATLGIVRHSVLSTTPTAEKPALSDEERAERRRRLAERVFSPDGLDRDTLEHIEQLTNDES
jgi:hypothetical protein